MQSSRYLYFARVWEFFHKDSIAIFFSVLFLSCCPFTYSSHTAPLPHQYILLYHSCIMGKLPIDYPTSNRSQRLMLWGLLSEAILSNPHILIFNLLALVQKHLPWLCCKCQAAGIPVSLPFLLVVIANFPLGSFKSAGSTSHVLPLILLVQTRGAFPQLLVFSLLLLKCSFWSFNFQCQ